MNIKLIACKVLQREISLLSAKCENFIDISFIRQGFHNEPEKLREILQSEIDAIDENRDHHTAANRTFDAIAIGYGLCSNGIVNISSKKYPLVVPKAHDCITLILGSKERYKQYFDRYNGGVYWYTPGWIENTIMPSKTRFDMIYNEYAEKYGEDNARYLMNMEQSWMTEYSRCTYINWKALEFPAHIEYSRECARYMAWAFELVEGDSRLLGDLIGGKWDGERFLVVPPNRAVAPSHDDEIVTYR
jgi:hypothetical protein